MLFDFGFNFPWVGLSFVPKAKICLKSSLFATRVPSDRDFYRQKRLTDNYPPQLFNKISAQKNNYARQGLPSGNNEMFGCIRSRCKTVPLNQIMWVGKGEKWSQLSGVTALEASARTFRRGRNIGFWAAGWQSEYQNSPVVLLILNRC